MRYRPWISAKFLWVGRREVGRGWGRFHKCTSFAFSDNDKFNSRVSRPAWQLRWHLVRANNTILAGLVIGCDKKWLAREDYVAMQHGFAIFTLQSPRARVYKRDRRNKNLIHACDICASWIRKRGYERRRRDCCAPIRKLQPTCFYYISANLNAQNGQSSMIVDFLSIGTTCFMQLQQYRVFHSRWFNTSGLRC